MTSFNDIVMVTICDYGRLFGYEKRYSVSDGNTDHTCWGDTAGKAINNYMDKHLGKHPRDNLVLVIKLLVE